MLQSMGSQRVEHDLATEQKQKNSPTDDLCVVESVEGIRNGVQRTDQKIQMCWTATSPLDSKEIK